MKKGVRAVMEEYVKMKSCGRRAISSTARAARIMEDGMRMGGGYGAARRRDAAFLNVLEVGRALREVLLDVGERRLYLRYIEVGRDIKLVVGEKRVSKAGAYRWVDRIETRLGAELRRAARSDAYSDVG